MKPDIEEIFDKFRKNSEMISYLKANIKLGESLVAASMLHKHPKSWRAAMLLGHIARKDDEHIKASAMDFIDFLGESKNDGHQRQILIILDKISLNEEQEGHLFSHCMDIWEDINKIPSTRFRAFTTMIRISQSHPELKYELRHFLTDYYVKTLSPGVLHSLNKRIEKIDF